MDSNSIPGSKFLYTFLVIPILLTFIFYSFLHPKFSTASQPLNHLFLQSYKPSSNYSLKQTPILGISTSISSIPSPIQITGNNQQTSSKQPAIGGFANPITIAVLGDSMIDTLKPNIPQLATALKKTLSQPILQYPKLRLRSF